MADKLIELSLDKLKTGMVIHSYDGFDQRYDSIDKTTMLFLQHNFRGTRFTVFRKGVRKKITSQDILIGDSVFKIDKFPAELSRITEVSKGLIKELQKRGMTRFTIRQKDRVAASLNASMRELLDHVENETKQVKTQPVSAYAGWKNSKLQVVSDLVEKVSQSVEVKDKMTHQIEDMMDGARKGAVNLKAIKQNLEELNASTEAMSAIVSLKESKLAYEHSLDVAVLFKTIYVKMSRQIASRSVFSSEDDILLAGILHDIGKAKIPKCILHNSDELEKNSRELQILRSHPYVGSRMLADLNLPDIMVNMARYHHVKKNTEMINSYPQAVEWDDVAFETRLLTVIDIYQSLVGKRNYKKSWAPNSAIKFISVLSGIEFDVKAWSIFSEAMGIYPLGSMVQLNDGSVGFVMNTPDKARRPDRPLIAVTRTDEGEDLSRPHVIDLQVERDFRIAKEVDCYSIYGKNAIKVFSAMRVA